MLCPICKQELSEGDFDCLICTNDDGSLKCVFSDLQFGMQPAAWEIVSQAIAAARQAGWEDGRIEALSMVVPDGNPEVAMERIRNMQYKPEAEPK